MFKSLSVPGIHQKAADVRVSAECLSIAALCCVHTSVGRLFFFFFSYAHIVNARCLHVERRPLRTPLSSPPPQSDHLRPPENVTLAVAGGRRAGCWKLRRGNGCPDAAVADAEERWWNVCVCVCPCMYDMSTCLSPLKPVGG